MKTKLQPFSCFVVALAVWSALSFQTTTALAQGTAFTYQGRLYDGANPANGRYDLRFYLYNAVSGGSLVAGPITNAPVVVTNGLFTVILNFGAGVFTGPAVWLDIAARSNGVAVAYTSLAPRQPLTPTPYAIFAEGANAANLVGTIPAGDLSGVSGTGLTGVALLAGGNTFTGNQTVNGTVQVNGPELITGASGAGFHVDENIGPNTYFAGEEHGINFNYAAGSSQNIGSLIMGWNGQGYFSVGNLYYGIGQLGTKAFTVWGTGNVNIDPMGLNNGFLNNGNTNGSGLTFGSGSGEGIASKRSAGGNQYGLDFYTSYTPRMSINQSGFVGIGTSTAVNPADTQFELYSPTTNNYDGMWIATGAGGLPFYGYSEGGGYTAWTMVDGSDGNKWKLYDGGFWLTVMPSGNVGIGTTSPSSALEVANGSIRTDGNPLFCTPTGSVNANDGLYNGSFGLPFGINYGANGPGLWGYYGGSLGALAPNVMALSWDASGDVWVSNNLSTATLTIRGGADLAEPFNITTGKSEVPQGAVVVIDEENPGHLKLSDRPYDTRVAGIVSGANGVNPGIQMHQQGLIEGGKNVALTGRVYAQADAANGAIKPGDMLTTSSTPGHAMKVSDHAKAAGAILGKAMTGLSAGKGMVLVLVTLQ